MSSDCLVLRVVENTCSKFKYDQEVFILWDTFLKKYIIRGRRSPFRRGCAHGNPYSYTCTHMLDVLNFLYLIIDPTNDCKFELYNYDNLPYDSDDITVDFLSNGIDLYNEVVAYDDMFIDSTSKNTELVKALKSLKSIYNEY